MKHCVEVSLIHTPALFQACGNLINEVSNRIQTSDTTAVRDTIEREHGIIIDKYRTFRDGRAGYHRVTFRSEQDYALFLLKWL